MTIHAHRKDGWRGARHGAMGMEKRGGRHTRMHSRTCTCIQACMRVHKRAHTHTHVERMGGRTNGWVVGRIDKRMDEQTERWTNGRTGRRAAGWMRKDECATRVTGPIRCIFVADTATLRVSCVPVDRSFVSSTSVSYVHCTAPFENRVASFTTSSSTRAWTLQLFCVFTVTFFFL